MSKAMKTLKKSGALGAVAFVAALGMTGATGAYAAATHQTDPSVTLSSHAAKKTITCYKGKLTKKVVALKPKCPVGYTTKKPAAPKVTAKTFSATYNGTMSLLWSSSNVKVTSISGTSTGANLGLTSLKSGTGTSSPTSTCDPISGTGTLSGPSGTLVLSLATTSKGCAVGSAAPTLVTVTGSANVVKGTGKYLGAKGSLAVKGSFSIKSTTAGSNESDTFTATLTGKLTLK
ncbi:MAG: hypothetical protein HKL86_00625 [Acidimicrobiaceae bacterium]|nr:hypothetical protein [Acidimicrobiaceae bacterium]